MISKIECQLHKGQKITAICVDSFCTSNTQCCATCVKELHDVHEQKLVSLESLQQFISNQEIIKKQNTEYTTVKQQLITIRLDLASLTELIDQKIDQLNKNQLGLNMQIDQLLQCNSDELAIVKVLLSQYEINNYQVIGINEQMKKKMEMQITQLIQQIVQCTAEYTKKMKQNISKLSVEQFKEELKFSDIYKHKHVQLAEGRTATLTQQIGYAVVFSDSGFDPQRESFICSFVVNKLSYGLVGFGQLDACKAMQYQIYDFSKGHGFFALQNTGVIYNSDDVSVNNTKVKSLTYDKSDQIICQYDAQLKQFTFMKESDKNEKYLMKLIDTSKKLYPVAILFGPGDSISFV